MIHPYDSAEVSFMSQQHIPNRRHGLTIIELLIVFGIIGILLALVMTAVMGAKGQGKKLQEKNSIRQLGNGWLKYSQLHRDRVMPGWLSTNTQEDWESTILYPDGQIVPPAPSFSSGLPNIAGPWTYRLLPYVDNEISIFREHLDRDPLNHWSDLDTDKRQEIGEQPGFGMNAYFMGGVWDRWYNNMSRTHPRFSKSLNALGKKVNLPVTSLSMMRNPSTVITFISNAGGTKGELLLAADDDPGHWLATPHRLGEEGQWSINDRGEIELIKGTSAPIGRHGGRPVTWHPDGHVESISLEKLRDQQRWIDRAEDVPGYPAENFWYEEDR
ncbi:MAG: hypothetical protein CMJ39_13020 [Phycisphaerae bacterium]|nr:hypothetical protein [Phycisphaerae bacterium]